MVSPLKTSPWGLQVPHPSVQDRPHHRIPVLLGTVVVQDFPALLVLPDILLALLSVEARLEHLLFRETTLAPLAPILREEVVPLLGAIQTSLRAVVVMVVMIFPWHI